MNQLEKRRAALNGFRELLMQLADTIEGDMMEAAKNDLEAYEDPHWEKLIYCLCLMMTEVAERFAKTTEI